MSRYFVPYEVSKAEDPTYPEEIRFIRVSIEYSYGKFKCSNKKIGELWREFSDEVYDAGFMDPYTSSELIEEFAKWLISRGA